jgi:hypothetical protein
VIGVGDGDGDGDGEGEGDACGEELGAWAAPLNEMPAPRMRPQIKKLRMDQMGQRRENARLIN